MPTDVSYSGALFSFRRNALFLDKSIQLFPSLFESIMQLILFLRSSCEVSSSRRVNWIFFIYFEELFSFKYSLLRLELLHRVFTFFIDSSDFSQPYRLIFVNIAWHNYHRVCFLNVSKI